MSQSNLDDVVRSRNLANSKANVSDRSLLADAALARLDEVTEVIAVEALRDHRATMSPKLSVIIPAYNECRTIEQVIQQVRKIEIDKQIIVVDDGGTDGTREILAAMGDMPDLEVFFHAVNQGKGAALQTGFRLAMGDIVIVQDADLEYHPEDILRVIDPILRGEASVVFGSRYLEDRYHNSSHFHRFGNWALTSLSNLMNGQCLTDMETCYKAFRRELLQRLTIEQRRFGFEPEITAKLARLGLEIREVPVRYDARSWTEGKKIGWRDLISTLYCIVRYRWFRPSR